MNAFTQFLARFGKPNQSTAAAAAAVPSPDEVVTPPSPAVVEGPAEQQDADQPVTPA